MFLSLPQQSSQMVVQFQWGLAFSEVADFFYNLRVKLFLLENNHLFVTSMCEFTLSLQGKKALSLLPRASPSGFRHCTGSRVSTGSASAHLADPGSPRRAPFTARQPQNWDADLFRIQFINTCLCSEITKIGCLLVMNKYSLFYFPQALYFS